MTDSGQERSVIENGLKHTIERVTYDILLKVFLKDSVQIGKDIITLNREANASDFKPILDELYSETGTLEELIGRHREKVCAALSVYEGHLESMRERVLWVLSSGQLTKGDDRYLKETEQELDAVRQLIMSHCKTQGRGG